MPALLRRFYPWLVELWIASILFAFFLVRILGSSIGQRVLTFIERRHFP